MRGRHPEGLPRRHPNRSRGAYPGRAKPRCALLRAAAAGRCCVLGQPQSPPGDAGMPQGRFRGLRSGRAGAKMLFEFPILILILTFGSLLAVRSAQEQQRQHVEEYGDGDGDV
jgi:hypothetical protein